METEPISEGRDGRTFVMPGDRTPRAELRPDPLAFRSYVDVPRHWAEVRPDGTAYVFLQDGEAESSRLTFRELDEQARAIAAHLQRLSATGSRVLLLFPPGLEFIGAFLGCLYAGTVAVPAYPPSASPHLLRLQAITADAQAGLVVSTSAVLADIERRGLRYDAGHEVQWVTVDDLPASLATEWRSPDIDRDALAFLQYTSGSTGTPKGVVVTHGSLLYNQEMIRRGFEHTRDTVFVGWLPLFHDMGLVGNVLQPLYLGIPSVLMPPVAFLQRPVRWLSAISRYRATTSGAPNFAYDLCAGKVTAEQKAGLDLSGWQIAYNGSEPVRADTLARFSEAFEPCGFRPEACYPCYGMAETTLFATGGPKGRRPVVCTVSRSALATHRVVPAGESGDAGDAQAIVGCGRTWMDQKVRIVDPGSLTECAPGRIGEIWVSGPNVSTGYFGRPVETRETFGAHLAGTGEGPFLRTGDLGFLRDGELFVTGRVKDVIIVRGRNHYPQDIELTVSRAHPALRQNGGAAFTVDIDGEPRLVVVQEVERDRIRKLDHDEVAGDVREAVAVEHGLTVHGLVLIKPGSIPRTSSGKIQRHLCRTRFLDGAFERLRARPGEADDGPRQARGAQSPAGR